MEKTVFQVTGRERQKIVQYWFYVTLTRRNKVGWWRRWNTTIISNITRQIKWKQKFIKKNWLINRINKQRQVDYQEINGRKKIKYRDGSQRKLCDVKGWW